MPELNWSIVWMLVVLMITGTVCAVVIMALVDSRKDSASKRKIAEHEAFGGGGDGRPGMD